MSTDTEKNENLGMWDKFDKKYEEMTAGPNGYIYKILFWGTIIGLIIFVIIFLFVAPIRNFAVAAGLFGADMTSKYMFQDSQDANFLTILSIILGGILVAAITLGVVIGGGFLGAAVLAH